MSIDTVDSTVQSIDLFAGDPDDDGSKGSMQSEASTLMSDGVDLKERANVPTQVTVIGGDEQ